MWIKVTSRKVGEKGEWRRTGDGMKKEGKKGEMAKEKRVWSEGGEMK